MVEMSENDPPRGPWVRGGDNTRPLWCNYIHRHTMTVAKWTGFPIGKSTCCMTKTEKREKCKMSCGFIRPGPFSSSVKFTNEGSTCRTYTRLNGELDCFLQFVFIMNRSNES